uniref:Lipoprotein n=1 Tax=Steinernema glaseri TaxID=37863 RepID=A0A1I7ZXP1_9BILA
MPGGTHVREGGFRAFSAAMTFRFPEKIPDKARVAVTSCNQSGGGGHEGQGPKLEDAQPGLISGDVLTRIPEIVDGTKGAVKLKGVKPQT